MENLIKCKISREDLKALYEKLCVNPDTENTYCDKCILGNIEWVAATAEWQMSDKSYSDSKEITRDLCFAIWHDDILNEPEGKFVPHL